MYASRFSNGLARKLSPGGLPAIAVAMTLAATGTTVAESRFERTAIYLEQNVQDEDSEVKIEAIAGSAGLTTLRVVAPDGRTVLDVRTPESKLGMRHHTLESPEPHNDGRLQADFPEGTYRFTGTATDGDTLNGEAVLSHSFPSVANVMRPRDSEKNVPLTGLQVKWNPVKDATALIVAVEHEESGRQVTATLPGSATSFSVPEGFLAAHTTYKLAIGTVAKSGNRSFTETSFTTASRK
jgi:hypothetical protein